MQKVGKIKNNTEKIGRKNNRTGDRQDADICKCSDIDLEKASSSGWLVNRGVKLPCGSQSMGKSPAHWFNLYISVINVYCLLKPEDYWNFLFFSMFCYLCVFFTIWILGMKTEHNLRLSRGYNRNFKTSSLALLESAHLTLFLCSVSLPTAQTGSHCGNIQNSWSILYCKCFAFIEPEMHFCMKLSCFDILTEIVHIQFTGNHHLLWQKRKVISDVNEMYCTNIEFCIWQTSFFCVAHVMEIIKTVWENGFGVTGFLKALCACVWESGGKNNPSGHDLRQHKHNYNPKLAPLFYCIKLHPIFPCSLVAFTNEHLSILREVFVINDSITHHPVRSHSTHPCVRPI